MTFDGEVECQTEMATYVLFTVHTDTDDDNTLIFYSIDDGPYQSGSSSVHDEPGNEDSVMAQPSFGFALGGHSSNQTC